MPLPAIAPPTVSGSPLLGPVHAQRPVLQHLSVQQRDGFLDVLVVSHGSHLARGGLLGMNGNYGGGVLEGLVHFLPETVEWLQ